MNFDLLNLVPPPQIIIQNSVVSFSTESRSNGLNLETKNPLKVFLYSRKDKNYSDLTRITTSFAKDLNLKFSGSLQDSNLEIPTEMSILSEQFNLNSSPIVMLLLLDQIKQFPDNKTEECYRIYINTQGMFLVASRISGIHRGVQTLYQIFQLGNATIPFLTIEDWPKFSWRGCLLDCSRHFMSLPFLLNFLDILAYHKINRFHFHLVDDQGWRLEIPNYEKLISMGAWRYEKYGSLYGGFYTMKDIEKIVYRADELGIIIVPEIEMPGHCSATLAAYPHLSCTGKVDNVPCTWGVFEDVYCTGNEKTFEFLIDVLKCVCTLFPNSPYIHIGGDEVPKSRWKSCSKDQARIREYGLSNEEQLQSWFIGRVAKELKAMNRFVIGWDEILEGGSLPEGSIIQSWRGFSGATDACKLGFQSIVSPTSHCYFDYPHATTDLEKVYSFDPIPPNLASDKEGLILGGECCLWSERAPESLVYMKLFPRILALSTSLWLGKESKSKYKFEEFTKAVNIHIERRLKKWKRIECTDGLAKKPRTLFECTITTSLPTYEKYYPENSFDGDEGSYFWSSRSLIADDYFDIKFKDPVKKQKIRVMTGLPLGNERDRLEKGRIEVLLEDETRLKKDFIDGNVLVEEIKSGIKEIRIICTKEQSSWLTIRWISLE